MSESIPSPAMVQSLRVATMPGARQKIVARGLARGMIWRSGVLPDGAPAFAESLTTDLLDHGYSVLTQALILRDAGSEPGLAQTAFRVAAEAIESAVRKGDADDAERGFHLVVAAAAFHLGHYAARSYCLIPADFSGLNLSTAERALAMLMRRGLRELRRLCIEWLRDPEHSDDTVATKLEQDDQFDLEDVLALSLTRNFCRALATFDYALQFGDAEAFIRARALLVRGTTGAAESHFVPLWWVNSLARHMIEDLWGHSLHQRLPRLPDDGTGPAWNQIRAKFIASLSARDLAQVDLWPSQVDAAARVVDPDDDLVVALPTSAGKTRIAELCILRTLASGKRVVYVTPLRALSAQVEWTLAKTFRPLGYSVSSLYGAAGVAAADIGSLAASAIVIATPEKLDFAIRQQPTVLDDVGLVVLDEGHMIGLGTREIRYEVLVQRLLRRSDAKQRRLVCLSAIFDSGEPFDDFTTWLRSDAAGTPVQSDWRPTRQRPAALVWSRGAGTGRLQLVVDEEQPFVPAFVRLEAPIGRRRNGFPQDEQELVTATAKVLIEDEHRVLIYCPQRTSVETLARRCLKLSNQGYLPSFLRVAPERIERAKRIGAEWLGADHVAVRALDLGIAVHHGALPRPFLTEVEGLLTEKALPLAIASPTLAQGIDLSCSAMIFYSLYRAGEPIPSTEFANVIGRAGRAYVDLDGLIILPVFDQAAARKRIGDYNRLLRQANSRSMESGIVMLVQQIASLLAAQIGGTPAQVIEYVTNHTGPWVTDSPPDDDEEDGRGGPSLPELIADLDTAILGTVDRLDCDVSELADVLDEALRGSLWARRLSRQDDAARQLQRAVLIGRAKWIWRRSTESRRRGLFAAGIGFDAGQFINDHTPALLASLARAELAVLNRDATEAAAAVTEVAGLLFQVHPFTPDDLPDRWKELLTAWISGVPLGTVLREDAAAEVGFVQQGIVYQLVWGVEAVRVHAQASDASDAEGLTGAIARALTFGAPTIQAAMLIEAGLASRDMAVELTVAYEAGYIDDNGMRFWLDDTIAAVGRDGFWKTPERTATWSEFVSRWNAKSRSDWAETERRLDVTWEPFYEAVAGQNVRVVDDTVNEVTDVCAEDLSVIGVVKGRYTAANTGRVAAQVNDDLESVTVTRWGPGN